MTLLNKNKFFKFEWIISELNNLGYKHFVTNDIFEDTMNLLKEELSKWNEFLDILLNDK